MIIKIIISRKKRNEFIIKRGETSVIIVKSGNLLNPRNKVQFG